MNQPATTAVHYERSGTLGIVRLDDGKANAIRCESAIVLSRHAKDGSSVFSVTTITCKLCVMYCNYRHKMNKYLGKNVGYFGHNFFASFSPH